MKTLVLTLGVLWISLPAFASGGGGQDGNHGGSKAEVESGGEVDRGQGGNGHEAGGDVDAGASGAGADGN